MGWSEHVVGDVDFQNRQEEVRYDPSLFGSEMPSSRVFVCGIFWCGVVAWPTRVRLQQDLPQVSAQRLAMPLTAQALQHCILPPASGLVAELQVQSSRVVQWHLYALSGSCVQQDVAHPTWHSETGSTNKRGGRAACHGHGTTSTLLVDRCNQTATST
mmetsp:Transcript_35139/g.58886  ORF Transcript_35139/g.58886 Transcript_35139/m.58886 type:complete len:158 (+) Transcript_35139:383-856(+)